MIKTFRNLTSFLKKKIEGYCKNDDEMVSKLEFWFLRFEDDKNPYTDVISIVDENLRQIDSNYVYAKDLVNIWRGMLEKNGRDKETLLDFKYIIGSVFSHVLTNAIKYDDVYDILNPSGIDYSSKMGI